MPTLPLHLAPELLVLFMLALAVVPLAIMWVDEWRKRGQSSRLVALREAAKLQATLSDVAQSDQIGLRRGVRLPQG